MTLQTLFLTLRASLLAILLPFGCIAAAAPFCVVGDAVSVQALPKQGQETLALIRAGGPFPNTRDGISFSNREKILPQAKRGFYREYTVRTPGIRHRGARRIVCGEASSAGVACYYSDDHYQSFKCIVP